MRAESNTQRKRRPRGQRESPCPHGNDSHDPCRLPMGRDGPDAPTPDRCGRQAPPPEPRARGLPPPHTPQAANEYETREHPKRVPHPTPRGNKEMKR